MSTKHFCDECGIELTDKNDSSSDTVGGRLSGKGKVLVFEIMTGTGGVSNAGDFCKYCVLDAVKTIDDRAIPV